MRRAKQETCFINDHLSLDCTRPFKKIGLPVWNSNLWPARSSAQAHAQTLTRTRKKWEGGWVHVKLRITLNSPSRRNPHRSSTTLECNVFVKKPRSSCSKNYLAYHKKTWRQASLCVHYQNLSWQTCRSLREHHMQKASLVCQSKD